MRSTERALLALLAAALLGAGVAAAGVDKKPQKAGTVSVDFDSVSRNGHHVDESDTLYPHDVLKTNSRGQAQLELKSKNTDCTTSGAVTLTVQPQPKVVLKLGLGELDCSIAGRDCHLKLKAGAAS